MESVANNRRRRRGAGVQDIFAHGGATGALMRSLDWAATPLGEPEQWPQSLRTAVSICLHSRFPILIWWGEELAMLYNDAYERIIADKHPHALGAPGRTIFPEIWDVIGPMLESVLHDGAATWSDDQLLLLNRNGFSEECYFTFSYSPIFGESGHVDGVFTAVTETTARVLGERRLNALRSLAADTANAHAPEEACALAALALDGARDDLPFARIYLRDDDSHSPPTDSADERVHLIRASATTHCEAAGAAGAIDAAVEAAVAESADATSGELARVARVAHTGEAELIEAPLEASPEQAGAGNHGAPSSRPHRYSAWLLPIKRSEHGRPVGVLVAGISPTRPLDDDYRAFLTLVAGQLAAAIATASAYEHERRRAEELTALDSAKTIFFNNVSHEFRTPLTLMLGPLRDLLDDAATPAAMREQLDVIHRNGLRLLRLVNALLEFSRLEAGRIGASFAPLDLSAYTAELASVFRAAIERAGLRLIVECPPLETLDLPAPVYVDREMWERIVFNLLSNAFKFTFAGSISVIMRKSADGGAVELIVRDTGVGIPADELPHLFERFYRVQGTRARTFEGTGIGLALTQELVKLHGGAIRVESVAGEGTTFTITLPTGARHLPAERIAPATETATPSAAQSEAEPYIAQAMRWLPEEAPPAPAVVEAPALAADAERAATVAAPTEATSRRSHVLVADDNADMRDYLRRLLAPHYDVETVADGVAALAAARKRPPDLALADVMMPELDGFGLLRALRADPQTRAIPVMLLSARAGEEATVEGLQAGADDYLVKPFSAREALARVAARLEMTHLRAEAEGARQHLRDLFMQAPAYICITRGPEHRIELVNDNFRALYGWREVAGKIAREAWPELEGQGFFELLDQVYATGEPFVSREVYARIDRYNDGVLEDGYFTLVYQPARDAHGAVEGILVHAMEITDQVRARESVRVEEAMASRRASELEAILDTIADGVVIYDEAGSMLRWNSAMTELFELGQMPDYAEMDVATRPERLHVRDEHGDPIPVDQLPFMRAARGETLTGIREVDLRVTTPSGRAKQVNASAAPLRDETGRVVGAVTVYRDVTERRQAEERLRAILDLLPVGVAFVDANGKALLVNQAVKTIWGEQIPVAESRSDFGQYHARWAATGKPVAADEWGLARALTTGEVSIGEEFDIETTDGVQKSILGSNAPLRDATGAIVGGMSVIMDISERKRLERRTHEVLEALLAMAEALASLPDLEPASAPREAGELAATRRLMRRMVTLAQRVLGSGYTSIVVMDKETGAIEPLAVVGLSEENEASWWPAVRGARLEDFISPADATHLYAGEDTIIFDVSERPPVPGQEYWGLKTSLVTPAALERQMLILTVELRDRPMFTPQERDLARAAAQLSALTVEREELQRERDLALAGELALTESNRRMDEFLGIASHELRTPLTSAQANVQLLGRRLERLAPTPGSDRAPTVEDLRAQLLPMMAVIERTERQMLRLGRLVSDLLDVTRISGGKLEFAPEACDLTALAREAVAEQRLAWPTRSIAVEAPQRAISIMADPDRIGQVVTNYLTNALKYSPPEEPVAVSLRVEDGAARVEVSDHGPGLAPEQQERLFERFYRVPGIAQQSGSGVGLGLGLSICRAIVERHGGAVGVESAPGAGSVFWFTLPLMSPTSDAETPG